MNSPVRLAPGTLRVEDLIAPFSPHWNCHPDPRILATLPCASAARSRQTACRPGLPAAPWWSTSSQTGFATIPRVPPNDQVTRRNGGLQTMKASGRGAMFPDVIPPRRRRSRAAR